MYRIMNVVDRKYFTPAGCEPYIDAPQKITDGITMNAPSEVNVIRART